MAFAARPVSLPEIWLTHARLSGDRIAAICGEQRLTWRELGEGMDRVAAALAARGVGGGATVGLLMSNSLDMLTLLSGTIRAGACLVPLSMLLTADQIGVMLSESEPRLLFVSASARHLIDRTPHDCLLVAVDFAEDGWTSLGSLLDGVTGIAPRISITPDDVYNIIYSSGTTGIPKGIVQTHRARLHWSWSNAVEMSFAADSVALVTTALYSNGTMFMVLPPLLVGATIVIMEKFDVAEALALIERHRVSHVFMVPTQAIMTLEHPHARTADLSSLRVWLSAGSPLRAETRAGVESRLTPYVYELYGFSEGFATMRKPWDRPALPGAVGRPVVGFDFRVIDDDGRELGAGEVGEVVGWGEGMMAGYHRNPEATAAVLWRCADGRDFIRSGDIGLVDDQGFLHIVERKKDMILSGGFNIFPADIEAIVAGHPAVRDVAVIGVPHAKWGESPLALVIMRDSVDPNAILAWANDRLAKTQRLVAVERRDEFPRNALGKVLKKELRAPYWEGHGH